MYSMSFTIVKANIIYNNYTDLNSITDNANKWNNKLEKIKISYHDNGRSGENVLWNLSNIDIDTANVEISHVYCNSTKDTIECNENNTTYRYLYRNNSLWLIGLENRLTKIDYDECEEYQTIPVVYGDSISGYYHGRGSYCDKITLRSFGHYKTIADAKGILILPTGDTIQNVTRLYTKRQIYTKFFPTDSLINKEFKSLNNDSLPLLIAKQKNPQVMDIYRWYAKDSKYPILETYALYNENTLIGKVAYYISQDTMSTSGNLLENNQKHKTRKEQYLVQEESNVCYNISQETTNIIKLDYSISTNSIVSYGLYTVDGKTIFFQPSQYVNKGISSQQINIPIKNKKGVYVFVITVNNKRYTSKIEMR